jgi:uncharacterized protein
MYAAGSDHPLRSPCLRILDLVETERLEAVTSAEVVQEIFHRFGRTPRAPDGIELARATLDLFSPVLSITHQVIRRVPDLAERYPHHSSRDLLHVATCQEYELAAIVSPDSDFDAIAEIERVAPEDEDAVERYLRSR